MGWQFRWRRSKNIGPLRITQTQRGTSFSFGIPGMRYTFKQNGKRQVRIGIPGTGISWTKTLKP